MQQYLSLLEHVLQNGERRANRTGIDTVGVFGYQMRFRLKAIALEIYRLRTFVVLEGRYEYSLPE